MKHRDAKRPTRLEEKMKRAGAQYVLIWTEERGKYQCERSGDLLKNDCKEIERAGEFAGRVWISGGRGDFAYICKDGNVVI